MNLTDAYTLKFMKGAPVFLDDICALYSPTIGEIVEEGYDKFQEYVGILTIVKPNSTHGDKELQELIKNLTDFQYVLLLGTIDVNVNVLLKEAFRFFTHEEITFSLDPPQIVIGPLQEKHILNEENFYDFQRIIRRMCFLEQEGEEIIIYASDDPITRRMKQQLRDRQEKLRRAKAKEAMKDKSDLKFSDLIGSLTINNCNLNILNIWDITYYAFHDQLKRMGWRDQFNINQSAALAGAKLDKSKLKHWMRSIANSDKA